MADSDVSRMAVTAVILLVLVAVPAAMAVDYTVGDASGWTQGFDYTTWVRGKTFRVGDVLEFIYGGTHTVDVVNKDGYDNCDASNSLQSSSDGDTKIPLNATGPMYFICATPGHCSGGMKLAVTVQASSGPTPGTPSAPRSPSPPSSTPGSPSPPSSTPGSPGSPPARTPPAPNAASRGGLMSYAVMGGSMVLGYGVWIMG
ncbi:PREDICTED: uclacyanin-2 [Tarenaya hassleriana]|uniref:uclacyanin-2 n=1 Tax=Tarenaya hassleriana TaxID=28532 RepID=UPI00053C4ECC|nr:PREDICTED: uclacyanin-2 [Tarenaya hassleriana]